MKKKITALVRTFLCFLELLVVVGGAVAEDKRDAVEARSKEFLKRFFMH